MSDVKLRSSHIVAVGDTVTVGEVRGVDNVYRRATGQLFTKVTPLMHQPVAVKGEQVTPTGAQERITDFAEAVVIERLGR